MKVENLKSVKDTIGRKRVYAIAEESTFGPGATFKIEPNSTITVGPNIRNRKQRN